MRRRCDSDKCAFSTDKLQSILPSIFFIFYRRRAAREQYFCHFIVTARRGNNIFAILSSPRRAETIFLPFYRHRAAREQYFCRFIVTAQRGNNIFAVLSSPRGAGTIFLPFYRRRAARERYFAVLSSPRSVPANASATPLKRGQIIRSSGRQTGSRC